MTSPFKNQSVLEKLKSVIFQKELSLQMRRLTHNSGKYLLEVFLTT